MRTTLKLLTVLGQGGLAPFSDDFARADGAVGNGWTGATWAISSGAAACAPTLGTEMFDPGDVSGYDWVAYGNNTLGDDGAGAVVITYVDNANGAYLQLRNSKNLTADLTVGTWYALALDVKINTGSAEPKLADGGTPTIYLGAGNITSTSYVSITLVFRATSATGATFYVSGMGAGEVVTIDNLSLKPITFTTILLTRQWGAPSVFGIGADVTASKSGQAGVVACLDDPTNPQNFLLAYHTNQERAVLLKCVGGTYTQLVYELAGYTAGSTLEIRRTAATTFQLWYKNAQVGTDQTVSDAGIIGGSNVYHGVFSSLAANSVDNFEIAT